jgi:predicted porin
MRGLMGRGSTTVGLVLLATVALAGLADAADLPPKSAAEGAPPDCFSSLWTYLSSSASDCPLTYAGVTLYGTLDGGYGYETHGVPGNPSAGKVNYGIQKNSNNTHWLWSPNALSTSVIGLKMKEDLGYGWSLIGAVEAGFDPYSGMLINAPRSRADNNVNALANQTANFNSSPAGQWDNAQGFIGLSNPVYGSLTFGRTNSLALDALTAYDPVASAAFSPLGFTSSFAGFGNSPTVRPNTAFTYRLSVGNFRVAAQAQVGGYAIGNASNGQYQGQIGADFGDLSLDGVVNWTRDAVSLSSYSGSPPEGYDVNSVLKATLSNSAGVELMARYTWGQFRFYAGYNYARLMNPSDDYANGFPTIAEGIFVPPGVATSNAYDINRILNTVWTGVRYSMWSNLDLAAGVYYRSQNDYLPPTSGACTGTGVNISSGKCAGSSGAASFLIDYQPVKRVDVYGGAMVSNVWGGFANGHLYTQNVDPTVGLRIRF